MLSTEPGEVQRRLKTGIIAGTLTLAAGGMLIAALAA